MASIGNTFRALTCIHRPRKLALSVRDMSWQSDGGLRLRTWCLKFGILASRSVNQNATGIVISDFVKVLMKGPGAAWGPTGG